MQITTTKAELASHLNFVSGAADPRGTVPMLSTVLLKATAAGKLSMLCSDTAVLARAMSPCQVAKEGEIAIDARRFGDLIRAFPDGKQSIVLSIEEKGSLLIKSGRSRFRLPTLPAADYPRMTSEKVERISITMSAKRIANMIDDVSSAMAISDVRTFLNGTLFSIDKEGLWCVATDGHRLNVAFEPIEGADRLKEASVIVPRKTVLLAKKMMGQSETVKLTIGPNDIQFTLEDATVILGKGIDGKFPNWRGVLPKTTRTTTITASQFNGHISLIKASMDAGVTKDAATKNRIDLTLGGNTALIQCGEDGRCEIEAVSSDNTVTQIPFNIDFLIDAASVAVGSGEKIVIGYENNSAAILMHPDGAEYPLCVVMPMRG
jgi:DNA polymerase-3 subunit beta